MADENDTPKTYKVESVSGGDVSRIKGFRMTSDGSGITIYDRKDNVVFTAPHGRYVAMLEEVE